MMCRAVLSAVEPLIRHQHWLRLEHVLKIAFHSGKCKYIFQLFLMCRNSAVVLWARRIYRKGFTRKCIHRLLLPLLLPRSAKT